MASQSHNREIPSIEHILNLFGNDVIGAFLMGHLVVEGLLIQFISFKHPNINANKKTFFQKVQFCEQNMLLEVSICRFLYSLNRVRNRFAHELGYSLTFDEAFKLAEEAGAAGIDFSDETIYLDKNKSEEWYGTEGIVQEIFQNTASDIAFFMEEVGCQISFFSG